MKKITINSKDYNLDKVIDFNAICELEDLGLSVPALKKSSMSAFRALLAWFGDITVEQAGAEIMAHLRNGGSFDDCAPLMEAFVESDFFRATQQSVEKKETATSEE